MTAQHDSRSVVTTSSNGVVSYKPQNFEEVRQRDLGGCVDSLEELLVQVDEEQNIIMARPRYQFYYDQKKICRIANVILYDLSEDKVLVQRRANKFLDPYKWDFSVGGMVSACMLNPKTKEEPFNTQLGLLNAYMEKQEFPATAEIAKDALIYRIECGEEDCKVYSRFMSSWNKNDPWTKIPERELHCHYQKRNGTYQLTTATAFDTPERTVRAELEEELGLRGSIWQRVRLIPFGSFLWSDSAAEIDAGLPSYAHPRDFREEQKIHCFRDVFLLFYSGGDTSFRLQKSEVDSVEWLPPHELEKKMAESPLSFAAPFRYVFGLVRQKGLL